MPANKVKTYRKGFFTMPAPNGCGIILFFQAAFPKSLQEVDSGLDSGLRRTHSNSRNPHFNQVRSPGGHHNFMDKFTDQDRLTSC